MKNVLAVAAVALFSACAQTPPAVAPERTAIASTVRPALPEAVAKCEYLDDVSSVSSRYGIFASAALDDTKAQVLTRAVQMGATHLVWEAPILAHGSTTSRGKAYRCA